jgi:mono/diheme cytochrome c family protein
MKKPFAFAVSVLLTGPMLAAFYSSATGAAAAQAPKVLDGKQIFLAQKCNLCHGVSSAGIAATVKSEKMKGPDLTGVTPKLDAKLLNEYLRKTAMIHDKKHGKEFTGSDEEMGALIAWLQKQEKK